jgi:tetratricopeptide (TPR) repeat protein
VLHDNGDYEGAIKKYDEALKIDVNDYDANYEKSMSLLYAKKYDECIALSNEIIQKFPSNPNTRQAYSNLGSALDDAGRQDEAIKAYNKGLEKFPTFYLLHFNKGLTFIRMKKYQDALESYADALKNNGIHASSNYYTGRILQNENRIPALLAYATFLAAEPQSDRSKEAFDAVQEIVYRGVKKEGNNTTINISMDMLDSKKKKKTDNDFSSIEFTFTLFGSMDSKEIDSIAKTAADKFDFKLQLLINSLETNQKNGKGFYWEHYAPFFIELKKKNYTIVLSNLIYYSADKDSQVWTNVNAEKVKEFYDWFQAYKW